MEFKLEEEYIELFKLIKVMDLVDSGAQAKQLIEQASVRRNGEIEVRKRAKIKAGEVIQIGEVIIQIV